MERRYSRKLLLMSLLAAMSVTALVFAQQAPDGHKAQVPKQAPKQHADDDYVRVLRRTWDATLEQNRSLSSALQEAANRLAARSAEVNELRQKLEACKCK